MTFEPNPVHHVALENRSAGQVALHIHFKRRHDRMTLGLFFGQLAVYMQGDDGIQMQPEIHPGGQIICLIPIQITGEERHFYAASRAVGYEPPNGVIPFMNEGSCSPITSPSFSRH